MSPAHRLARMSGRDPAEQHRTSTPLELLFDLTFVVGFSAVSTLTALLLGVYFDRRCNQRVTGRPAAAPPRRSGTRGDCARASWGSRGLGR